MAFNGASAGIRRPVETPHATKCKITQQFAKLLSGLNEWDQSLAFCLRMIFSENRFPLFGIMR